MVLVGLLLLLVSLNHLIKSRTRVLLDFLNNNLLIVFIKLVSKILMVVMVVSKKMVLDMLSNTVLLSLLLIPMLVIKEDVESLPLPLQLLVSILKSSNLSSLLIWT